MLDNNQSFPDGSRKPDTSTQVGLEGKIEEDFKSIEDPIHELVLDLRWKSALGKMSDQELVKAADVLYQKTQDVVKPVVEAQMEVVDSRSVEVEVERISSSLLRVGLESVSTVNKEDKIKNILADGAETRIKNEKKSRSASQRSIVATDPKADLPKSASRMS